MSTKIYNAYRLYSNKFVRFLEAIHDYRWNAIPGSKARVIESALHHMGKMDTVADQFEKWQKFLELHEKYKIQTGWNADTQLTMHYLIHKDHRVYFVLFGPDIEIERFTSWITRLTYVEEFHYQTSTGRPDHISEAKWNGRRKKWDELFKENRQANFMHFEKLEIIPDIANQYSMIPLWLTTTGVRPNMRDCKSQKSEEWTFYQLEDERNAWR